MLISRSNSSGEIESARPAISWFVEEISQESFHDLIHVHGTLKQPVRIGDREHGQAFDRDSRWMVASSESSDSRFRLAVSK
jgi:hypothetical protein